MTILADEARRNGWERVAAPLVSGEGRIGIMLTV
jgi:hypothetical protein